MPWLVTVSAAQASGAKARRPGRRREESRMVRRFMMLLAKGAALGARPPPVSASAGLRASVSQRQFPSVSFWENRAILRPRPAVASSRQESERRRVQRRVAGGDDAAVRGEAEGLALPIGEDSAGAFDDRHHGAIVVWFQAGFDDQIDEAAGDQAIGVAIAAVARQLDARLEAGEGVAVSAAEHVGRGGEEGGAGEIGAGAAANRAAVMRRLLPGDAAPALARNRLVDDAEHRPPLMEQRDQRAKERDARDEGFGAVDRIEHPDPFGAFADGAEFLAEDAVGRKTRLDQRPHRLFRLAVGDRHRTRVRLVVDCDLLAEIGPDHRAGGIRQRLGEGAPGGGDHGGRHAAPPISASPDKRRYRRGPWPWAGRRRSSWCPWRSFAASTARR